MLSRRGAPLRPRPGRVRARLAVPAPLDGTHPARGRHPRGLAQGPGGRRGGARPSGSGRRTEAAAGPARAPGPARVGIASGRPRAAGGLGRGPARARRAPRAAAGQRPGRAERRHAADRVRVCGRLAAVPRLGAAVDHHDGAAQARRDARAGSSRDGRARAGAAGGATGGLRARAVYRPELKRVQAARRVEGLPPSRQVARLAILAEWLRAQGNQFFLPIAALFLWRTRMAAAIESWRISSGPAIGGWLAAIGEVEALAALAAYAYENPADPFPEVIDGPAQYDGEGLGHPLLPVDRCVRNDVQFGPG